MMLLKVESLCEGDREGWREMAPGSHLQGKSDTDFKKRRRNVRLELTDVPVTVLTTRQ